MAVYSYAQLMSLWINAGGPRGLAPLAAAIAEAESGGNSDALNPSDNGGTQSSFGLWQISNGTHTPPSPDWANPAVNAQLAVGKWKGAGGFTPWGTYDSGAYKAFLNGKTTPDPNVPGNPNQQTAQLAAAVLTDCAIAIPSVHYGIFFGFGPGPTLGGQCIISKSEARAVLAVATIGAGIIVTIAGIAMIFGTAMIPRRAQTLVMPVINVTRDMVTSTREASRYQPKKERAAPGAGGGGA